MKILVISELHANHEFLKCIFAVEKTEGFDHIVMLGDYFDPHGDVATSDSKWQRVAGTLVGLKELHRGFARRDLEDTHN
jgi:predicted phosphodiesterase